MIFNDDILYIHVPKTGGMAVTSYLLASLVTPLTITTPDENEGIECQCCGHKDKVEGVTIIQGNRHENLEDASEILQTMDKSIVDFKKIIAVIRNPYDTEASIYGYLRNGFSIDNGIHQEAAIQGSFLDYISIPTWHYDPRDSFKFEKFYTMHGKLPENMHIIRFETLEKSLYDLLVTLNQKINRRLGMSNMSTHEHYSKYLTRASERLIYNRYKWVFDNGYYNREIVTRKR